MKKHMSLLVQVLLKQWTVVCVVTQLVGVAARAAGNLPQTKHISSSNGRKSVVKKISSARSNSKLGNLSTDVRFDGSAVHGKFQTAADGVATVEDDKYLDDLLGVRKNFADREAANKTRD